MRPCKRILVALSVMLFAREAGAQFGQYTPPGGPGERPDSPQEVIEEEIANARWHLGPLRLAPWIGIQQAGYVSNVFASEEGATSDFTATVGAGLTAYLPTGRDTTWTFQAVPAYVWWADLEERRQLVGRYGAGFFGYYNRLEVEAKAGRLEEQSFVTSELNQFSVSREDRAELSLELRLSGSLWVFASGTFAEFRDRTEGTGDPRAADFSVLDREDSIYRAGLSWVRGDGFRVALGVERTEEDFAPGARALSNQGTAPILEIELPGRRIDLQLGLALRSLDRRAGSIFVPFDETTGEASLTLRPGWRFNLQLYGRRNLIFSLLNDYAYFREKRLGLAVWFPLAERLRLRTFLEEGENDYQGIRPGTLRRTDDASSLGADLSFDLPGPLSLTTGYQRLEFDSNLPGFDRDLNHFTLSLGLNLGGRLLWQ